MEAELYLDYNTAVHRLDARTKLLLFVFIFIAIFSFEHPLWLLPPCLVVAALLVISGAVKNLRRIRHVLIVLVISSLILWNLFTNGETPLFWFVEVESLLFAVGRMLFIFTIICLGFLLVSTTRNEELILGMIKLGLPYRVGFAISTALRLMPTIAASMVTISQAQRSRGLDMESGSPLARLRKFLPVLVPVFLSSIRNTNILGMALESRGFGARPNRTFYLTMQFGRADYVILALSAVYLAASLALSLAGYGKIDGLIRF